MYSSESNSADRTRTHSRIPRGSSGESLASVGAHPLNVWSLTPYRNNLQIWMLKVSEKHVRVRHQVWKWLKTDCFHRRAAVQIPPGQPTYSTACQNKCCDLIFRINHDRSSQCSGGGKNRSIVGVIMASTSHIQHRCFQRFRSPYFYVTLHSAAQNGYRGLV